MNGYKSIAEADANETDSSSTSTLPGECCSKCKFARGMITHPELRDTPHLRICHRYPPKLGMFLVGQDRKTSQPNFIYQSDQVRVLQEGWCGEYSPAITN